jgi:hypothetical protein
VLSAAGFERLGWRKSQSSVDRPDPWVSPWRERLCPTKGRLGEAEGGIGRNGSEISARSIAASHFQQAGSGKNSRATSREKVRRVSRSEGLVIVDRPDATVEISFLMAPSWPHSQMRGWRR